MPINLKAPVCIAGANACPPEDCGGLKHHPTPRCRVAEAGVEPSVGSKGDSYDNALTETVNGLCKAELIHRRAPWKTKESLELAALEWVSWFNHHRLLARADRLHPASRG